MEKVKKAMVGEAMALIPEPYKGLLIHKYSENMTYEEIAEKYLLDVDHVKRNLFEGRRLLLRAVEIIDDRRK